MNAAQLAKALGFKRSGNQWVGCCVAHADRNPSMIIFEGKTGAVQVRCLAGCDPLDIIGALRAMGFWDGSGRGDDIDVGLEQLRKNKPHRSSDYNRKLAARLWDEAVDPTGTPAEEYLNARGLSLPPDSTDVIRYHPQCQRGDETSPALVILMRNVETFEPTAIQRIFIEQGLLWVKHDAMMLGDAGGAAMMLSPCDEIFAGREPEEGPVVLHVAEGFETALALYVHGVIPIWAMGSAGAIGRLPVIDGVPELVICADNDANEVGLKFSAECMERWKAAGRTVAIRMPPNVGQDWADHITGVPHGD